MKISQVAAMGKNRVLGLNGQLPWHVPADLKHFKSLTTGKMVLMGRKTYDSVGKPLPGRLNLVVTSNPACVTPQPRLEVFTSVEAAIDFARTKASEWHNELCIVGGGEIYRQTLVLAEHIYLTVIDYTGPGDAFFPPLDSGAFELMKIEPLLGEPGKAADQSCELFHYARPSAARL